MYNLKVFALDKIASHLRRFIVMMVNVKIRKSVGDIYTLIRTEITLI